jgi:tRNA nucleotidyltransferase (CCA-adding enzyme)
MKLNPPMIVEYAIEKLNNSGYEAYLVGGSVRDAIMGYDISDYDITTNASLDEIKLVFSSNKVKEYSNKITLCIIKNHEHIEVTPFKGKTIVEDLSNRDFTINSIAYDLKEIIDPFKGRLDLFNKTIRCPIDSKITITNDPLRMLRAIRFSGKYGFQIDNELKNTMKSNADLLLTIKKDRIKVELDKILLLDNPSSYIKEYKEIFFNIFPGLRVCDGFDQQTKYHNLDVLSHILKVVDNVDNNIISRLSALLHDIKKPDCFTKDEKGGHFYGHWIKSMEYANKILKDFNYSNDIIRRVCNLIEYHDYKIENNKKAILSFIYIFKTEDIDLLFDLKKADIIAQHPNYRYQIEELTNLYIIVRNIIDNKEYIDINTLDITNNELINIGVLPINIKDTVDKICKAIINNKINNKKAEIIEYIKNIN